MTGRSGSVAFDRAAEFYDRTRRLSAQGEEAVAGMLGAELAGRGRCLEVGVGTGRVALPLASRGIGMFGIDLSVPMLEKLIEKSGARGSVPVAVADATRLPFGDASFGAAIACHVLHLIPGWHMAVAEMVRVVVPGGVVLVDQGGWRQGVLQELEKKFSAEAGVTKPFVGLRKIDDLDRHMTSLGATVRKLPPVEDTRAVSPDAVIRMFEEAVFSFTWGVDETTRRRAAEATREWARQRFRSLEEPLEVALRTGWRGYELPARN